MRISTTFAELDRVCDYIPFVSTISNVVDLFQKYVCKCLPNVSKNRYWAHIKQKDLFRCVILLLPVLGNIYILVSDFLEHKKDRAISLQAIQSLAELERGREHALWSTVVSDSEVNARRTMPAPTEDQWDLFADCDGDDAQPIRGLLERGISPNFSLIGGKTPLVRACQHSTTEVVRVLVEAGAEVTTADRAGDSPFTAACRRGNLEMVQFLRRHIQDINAPNAQGLTPLLCASIGGHQNVVEFLIAQGANRNAVAPDGNDAVSYAISKDHAHLLPLLLTENEDVDARRYSFFSRAKTLRPLLFATLLGANNSAIYLVGRSNVQQLHCTNVTPLYYASKHMPLLQAVLNKSNAPEFVNQQNIAGSTALHYAIKSDRRDAALLLLQNGANPLISDDEGKTPLILACEKDFLNVVEYIQQHYADHITREIQEQVVTATQAAAAHRGQAFQEQTEIQDLQSIEELTCRYAQEEEDLGPIPRTGMELILGERLWRAC